MTQDPWVIFIVLSLLFILTYCTVAIVARLRAGRAKLERDRAEIIETIRRAAERDG